jgi:hypothetical protein
MTTITIEIGGPLADAINNLAAALQTSGLIERAQTASAPKAAKSKKAQPEVADNTGSNGSDQSSAHHSATEAGVLTIPPTTDMSGEQATPAAGATETLSAGDQSEAVAPINKKDLQTLASAKSKKVGVEKVKETIATFGGTNINTTSDEQLAALKVALEAL